MTPAFFKFADHRDERMRIKKQRRSVKRALLRTKAFVRQGGLCHWCKTPMQEKPSKWAMHSATLEHIIPEWVGGQTTEGNTVAACLQCNRERGASMAPPASAQFAPKDERCLPEEVIDNG